MPDSNGNLTASDLANAVQPMATDINAIRKALAPFFRANTGTLPLNDFLNNIAVTSTTLTKVYSYTVPPAQEAVLYSLSISADSNMVTNGTIDVVIKGQHQTSQAAPTQGTTLTQAGQTYPLSGDTPDTQVVIQAGETVVVNALVSSGTGHLNVNLNGILRVTHNVVPG